MSRDLSFRTCLPPSESVCPHPVICVVSLLLAQPCSVLVRLPVNLFNFLIFAQDASTQHTHSAHRMHLHCVATTPASAMDV